MKIKLYTKSHNEALLKEIDNNGRLFTAEEHAYVIEKEFAKEFESKESLLRWYLSQNAAKLSAVGFLIQYLNDKGFRNILSLGAGQCVLEYLLKYALPGNFEVIAADFDSFLIEKAKIHFPSIISVKFDFFKDDMHELLDTLEIRFDLVVFFGSTYVMDDSQFMHLFRQLKEIGIKQIIDFYGGFITYKKVPEIILGKAKSYITNKLRRIKIINKIIPASYRGKFHGYGRTRGELRRLYKKAGLCLSRELSVGPYKYIAICKAN